MFLFNTLKKDGMSPDAQSYAALLHLCSRTNNAKLAAAMLREMGQKVCAPPLLDVDGVICPCLLPPTSPQGIAVSDLFHNTTLTASHVASIAKVPQCMRGGGV